MHVLRHTGLEAFLEPSVRSLSGVDIHHKKGPRKTDGGVSKGIRQQLADKVMVLQKQTRIATPSDIVGWRCLEQSPSPCLRCPFGKDVGCHIQRNFPSPSSSLPAFF
mmetsp:Transcript_37614/g.56799  ORF Transcript_37614/g.56799 Transcript_37614/m.56799 type:complete len:107 (+) Transcript_37614:76-396(+)